MTSPQTIPTSSGMITIDAFNDGTPGDEYRAVTVDFCGVSADLTQREALRLMVALGESLDDIQPTPVMY